MKKQLFIPFTVESEMKNVKSVHGMRSSNLMRMYLNRFIIDEYAECEVIHETNLSTFFDFQEYGLIEKIKFLLFYHKSTKEFNFQTESSFKFSQLNSKYDFEDMNMHFIFYVPRELVYTNFLAMIRLFWVGPHRGDCTELLVDEIPQTNFEFASYLKDRNDTIGDDIDSLIHTSTSQDGIVYSLLKCFFPKTIISYKIYEESCLKIVCNRTFRSHQFIGNKFIGIFFALSLPFIITQELPVKLYRLTYFVALRFLFYIFNPSHLTILYLISIGLLGKVIFNLKVLYYLKVFFCTSILFLYTE